MASPGSNVGQQQCLYSTLMDFSSHNHSSVSMCNVSLADIAAPSPESALVPLIYQEPCHLTAEKPKQGQENHNFSSPIINSNESLNLEIMTTAANKKKAEPDKWKRNKFKNARVRGTAFVNGKGVVVPARKTGSTCSCKMNCLSKTTDAEKKLIINFFNKLGSKDGQDKHLQNLIVCRLPAQRKGKEGVVNRKYSFSYFVAPRDGKGFKVCKIAFSDYFGITVARVDRVCALLTEGKQPEDMRGKTTSANAVPDHVCWAVWDHIASFPVKKAYVPGNKKPVLYLDSKLNVKKMFKAFLQNSPHQSVKYNFYRQYFVEHFSFVFGEPESGSSKENV